MTALEIAAFGFHEVTDDPTRSGFQRPAARPYKQTRRAFREHLDRLARGPCVPELVTELDFTRPGRHLLLTFDDGGKSALTVSEELARRGWRAHFFIITSLIGTSTFLDAAAMRSLRSAGHVIGTHSHTHPDIFRDLSPTQMLAEWRRSIAVLEELLGEPCLAASVPGGDISRRVLESAGPAGLRYLFTSEPRLVPELVDGAWIVGRFGPTITTPPSRIAELAEFRGWTSALAVRRLKVLARWAVPPLYRLYVRQRTHARAARAPDP